MGWLALKVSGRSTYHCCRQKIIKIENDMQPVEVMFIYEIIKRIGQLADCAQQVGMQLIVVAAR